MSKRAEQRGLEAFPGQFIHDRCVFKFGYEQAEKDLGWHSVEECLPETGEEVIVLIDALNFHLFYRIAFGHIVNEKETVDIDGKQYKPESHKGWNIPGVKFWMPMPKLPEE